MINEDILYLVAFGTFLLGFSAPLSLLVSDDDDHTAIIVATYILYSVVLVLVMAGALDAMLL